MVDLMQNTPQNYPGNGAQNLIGQQSEQQPPPPDVGSAEVSFDDINGNWKEVQKVLNSRALGGTDSGSLTRAIEANARAAQVALFGGAVNVPQTEQNRDMISAPTRGGTVARAFWWGFHIQISHEDVQSVLNAIDGVEMLIVLLGPRTPAVVRPFLAIVRVFLEASKAVLQALDRGNGVYISMSWFAPGVILPSSV